MKVLALDLSLTAIGWARTTESGSSGSSGSLGSLESLGRPWERGVIKPRGKGVPRLQDAMNRIVGLSEGCDAALIEGYAYAARQSHAHSLGELGGVIRLALHQRGIPFVDVPPSTLKILATGKGNAGKELVLVEAVKRLGYTEADNNEADALWLLQMGLIHYGLPGAVELPKGHRRAFQKIEFPEVGVTVP